MTGPYDMTPEERGPELTGDERLAAEYAMGLLEGEDLLAARGRLAREPALAGMVAQWEQRLAPMLDDIEGAEPSPDLWEQIALEVDGGETGRIVSLQRRVAMWQRVAAGSAVAAVAAVALLVIAPGTTPGTPPDGAAPDVAAASQPPLVASIPIADTPLRVGLTYLPDREELLVAADGLTADGVHDHELWLLPPGEGAQVQSLGIIAPGTQKRVRIDEQLSPSMEQGAQILLSREPIGGAPDKSAPGPVVAQGTLTAT